MGTTVDKPTCETCPYWQQNYAESEDGACRRHAPRGPFRQATDFTFVPVHRDCFCGEHPDFPKWIEEQRRQVAQQDLSDYVRDADWESGNGQKMIKPGTLMYWDDVHGMYVQRQPPPKPTTDPD